mmetsp:Transcript_7151/g.18603  ORF Transcript_7151/g.18603 Transcript_7151/m.18603 type:complete len:462 (-) Transcript_7151:622-2007(-)
MISLGVGGSVGIGFVRESWRRGSLRHGGGVRPGRDARPLCSSLLDAKDLVVLALVAVRREGVRRVEVAELVAVVLARLVLELRHRHLDVDALDVLLRDALLQPRVALPLEVLVEQPVKDEDEELVHVAAQVEVARELALHGLRDGVLLRVDERAQHHRDGQIDVVVAHVRAQLRSRRRLCQADERLKVAHGDDDAARLGRLPAQLGVELDELVRVDVLQHGLAVVPRVHDELAQQRLLDDRSARRGERGGAPRVRSHVGGGRAGLHRLDVVRVRALVRVDHEAGQRLVHHDVSCVTQDAGHVEPREDRLGELHVVGEGERRLVPPVDGVGRRNHRAARLQRGDDASLGYGDALLLHRLVDRRAVLVVHLVELVDQAHAAVGEHQRATLERPLARHLVAVDRGGEPDGRGALARGVDGAVSGLLDVLEELRLGRARVAEQQHVDVATDAVLVVHVLGLRAEE